MVDDASVRSHARSSVDVVSTVAVNNLPTITGRPSSLISMMHETPVNRGPLRSREAQKEANSTAQTMYIVEHEGNAGGSAASTIRVSRMSRTADNEGLAHRGATGPPILQRGPGRIKELARWRASSKMNAWSGWLRQYDTLRDR